MMPGGYFFLWVFYGFHIVSIRILYGVHTGFFMALKVISEKDISKIHFIATEFLLPYEKQCCALMAKAINKDDSLMLIVEAGTERSVSPQVYGVITYNPKAQQVFCCIPFRTEQVARVLRDFFFERKVFCISGEESSAVFLEGIVNSLSPKVFREERNYFFMEFRKDGAEESLREMAPLRSQVIMCGETDCEALMPLVLDYTRVEVLPAWRGVNAPAERLSLERQFRNGFVMGIKGSDGFICKAHTNAISANYLQIGGVYTVESFRGRGLATAIVQQMALFAMDMNRQAVLFVKEKNVPAVRAYSRAGFVVTGRYRIVYYRN